MVPRVKAANPPSDNAVIRSLAPISTLLVVAVLAVAAGRVVPTLGGPTTLVVVAGLAILPILVHIAASDLALGLGLFMAAQPLEHFEYETPAGTLSPGVFLLAVMLGCALPEFARRVRSQSAFAVACSLGVLWLLSMSVTRLGYLAPSDAFRHTITTSSFLAVAVVAASLPATSRTLRVVAAGAGVAVLTFAVTGVLVSQGLLPEPPRQFNTPRSILGVESPFTRSYGLDVSIDSIALLAALPLAYLAVNVCWRLKLRHLVALGSLGVMALLVFQARGMVAQVILAAIAATALKHRRLALVVGPLAIVAVAQAAVSLYDVDRTSSSLRLETSRLVVAETFTAPQNFLAGRDEREIYAQGARSLELQYAVSGQDTIHNLFLSNLYGGGWLGFAAVGGLWSLIVGTAVVGYARRTNDIAQSVLLVACILVLLTLAIEPVASNTAGAWLVAGIALAWHSARAFTNEPD